MKNTKIQRFLIAGAASIGLCLWGAALSARVWAQGVGAAGGAAGGDGDTVGVIDMGAPGKQSISIALPLPVGLGGSQARDFWQVIQRDLEMTGYFRIVPPEASVEAPGAGLRPGEFLFSDWRTVGAMVLAKTGLVASPEGLRAEVWVYDVRSGEKLGAKAFTAPANAGRSAAHRLANEIMYFVTGKRGFFDTKVTFVGNFTGNKEIYVMDIDGYGRRQVTKNGTINLKPRWNPAGTAIAFTSYAAGNPDLYVADLGRGQIRRVSSRAGINTGGAFSPDGSLLAITLTVSGDAELYLLDAATGSQLARLTDSPGIDTSPTWSPDGSRIAFVSERGGGPQVYVMPSGGGPASRVSFAGSHCTDPAWSPAGDRIAFVARDGRFDVFTVGTDGKGAERITQGQGDNEDPSWSPDGNYVLFSSTRAGGNHLWLSSSDGSYQLQVSSGGGGYSNPHWSPHLSW